MKALIVDDCHSIRRMAQLILRKRGVTTIEADDGRTGLKLLQANPDIEFILVDFHMPIMNGLEFLRIVRSIPQFAAVKVVMTSADERATEWMQALDDGADEFIPKPFAVDMLLDRLKKVGVELPRVDESPCIHD